jgi:putative transcriptional regulator
MAADREILARNVIIYRARRELSQTALAEKAGVSRATVSGIERCVADPATSIVSKIAEVLGTSLHELFLNDMPPETASDEELAQLAKTAGDDAVDAHALIVAIDEAAEHSPERYSRAGRPRVAG